MNIGTVVAVGCVPGSGADRVVFAPVFLELIGIAHGKRDVIEGHVCAGTEQVGVGVGNRRFEGIIRHGVPAVQVTGQKRKGVIQAVSAPEVNGKGLTPVFRLNNCCLSGDRLLQLDL